MQKTVNDINNFFLNPTVLKRPIVFTQDALVVGGILNLAEPCHREGHIRESILSL